MFNRDYQRVAEAIDYIAHHVDDQPSLAQIAEHVHLSPYHFNRLFKRWAGITPKRYLQHLTLDSAKRRLHGRASLMEVAWQVGLSGTGRLHDLFVGIDAVTPGEYRSGGAGVVIGYGFHDTPFGECLIANTSRGICHLSFVDTGGRDAALAVLEQNWTAATLGEQSSETAGLCAAIFDPQATPATRSRLLLNGTNFQIKVWKALLNIPFGETTSYGDIATHLGRPGAARAVGTAVGGNSIAFLIPCHRVIRADGGLGGYRWGEPRKRTLLAWETSALIAQQ